MSKQRTIDREAERRMHADRNRRKPKPERTPVIHVPPRGLGDNGGKPKN